MVLIFEVQFTFCCIQGVLLSGPPGTGKTLFARTLSKQSGLPFVFASGAEFTDSEKSGAARINELFSVARRNVSFDHAMLYLVREIIKFWRNCWDIKISLAYIQIMIFVEEIFY